MQDEISNENLRGKKELCRFRLSVSKINGKLTSASLNAHEDNEKIYTMLHRHLIWCISF